MMRVSAICGAAMLVATPAAADLRPAPDYFIGALIASEVAQAVALNCPVLSVNPSAAQKMSEDVIGWLEADGFDPADPTSEMEDATDRLRALQASFMDKHQLAGANSDQVCEAGRREIADGTDIGRLLVEVSE